MKKFLGAAALALSLSACQQVGSSDWYQAYGSQTFPVAKDGMAALYIVRDQAPPDAPNIPITMSRNAVGSLASSNWMRLDLPPNPYDLRAYGSQENSELIITLVPGETRFLLAEPKANNDAQLTWLSQEDGRRLVKAGTQVGTYLNY